ncbi:Glucose-6-phosphate isomerase [Frankliniella fusca]|uniref:Glucose-6-phosphate isomerase n=1 Tax=Frankliniella fusca TaxID=407009 RepID=A0AAE1GQG6_9NEOP|nr:Glucose-6-phosphate isomerase [Frankliniella fusca]
MRNSLLHLLTVCTLTGAVSAGSLSIMGPYTIYAEKMYQCEPGESTGKITIEAEVTKFDVKRPHNLQLVTATMNMTRPFTDNYWGKVRVDAYSNGQWKPNALVFPFKERGCTNMRTHLGMVFMALFKKKNMDKKVCHVPAGIYSCDKEPMNWTFPHFPILPYGFYRFHWVGGEGDETYMCHNTEGHSIPRRG